MQPLQTPAQPGCTPGFCLHAPEGGNLTGHYMITLLAKDGVPLPQVPRVLESTGPLSLSTPISDLLMFSGSRADILLRCEGGAGKYALVSGAGPFDTHPACAATHCELFGRLPRVVGAPNPSAANFFYRGRQYSAAILATVSVAAPQPTYPFKGVGKDSQKWGPLGLAGLQPGPGGVPQAVWDGVEEVADPLFEEPVCDSNLDMFPYLTGFPATAVPHCYSFMNEQGGGLCTINGCFFGEYQACIDQGTTQLWTLRDTTFHSFHLHETPMQALTLPDCVSSTNFYQVNDWADVWQVPICVCEEEDPTSAVRTCDQYTTRFHGSQFSSASSVGSAMSSPGQLTPATCEERFSVFHCHVLPHEDEGCMALLRWACPDKPCDPVNEIGRCPSEYGVCEQQNLFLTR